MTITCNKIGVWIVDDVYKKTLSDYWVRYNVTCDSGTLWGWGSNSFGKLGDNTDIAKSSPVQIPGTNWLSVVDGNGTTHAIKGDNTLWGLGYNDGRLGVNNTLISSYSSPVQIPGNSWKKVSSYSHSLALKTNNTLWAWGCNGSGRLGDITTIFRSSPVQIPGDAWCQIETGGFHSGAIKTDGTLWMWGSHNYGQLANNCDTGDKSSPIQVAGNNWCDISIGNRPVMALKTDGTLWSWGFGSGGSLGDGFTSNRSSPVQVPGAAWVEVNNRGAYRHTVARKSDGTLWTWGCNNYGQLGDNTVINKSSPIQIPGNSWNSLSTRFSGVSATKTDGTLWSWGRNDQGQLGDNTVICRSSPIQIPGTCWIQSSGGFLNTHARKSYTPFIYDVTGTHLWSWGNTPTGDGTAISPRSSPVQILGANWTGSITGTNPFAIKSDGTLWVWGTSNASGRNGINCSVYCQFSSPVQIPGNQWSKVVSHWISAFAIKTDGTLWSWGYNNAGRLGDNSTIARSSPVQIPGTQWSDVINSACHTLATKTDGTLWAWGVNSDWGQLGIDNMISRSSPVQVPGTSWVEVAANITNSIARKTDGTVWVWGSGNNGRLGDNTTIAKSSPVQIPGNQWSDISAQGSGGHVLARKSDNTLWAWGYNGAAGRIGDGTTIPRSSPVQIPGNQWCVISAGHDHSAATKSDSTLWVWGCGSYGRLGTNDTINRASPVQIPGSWLNVSAAGGSSGITLATKCFTG